ncbi:MAG: M48 family metallopeptidase [Opitutales bacterium]|nr:M48 family metallopeptidase [Opitutales bacterium]
MDFFEAQSGAQKRSQRLVWLFGLAVALIVFAVYALISVLFFVVHEGPEIPAFWSAGRFFGVAAVVCAIIGIASLVKTAQFARGGSAVAKSLGAQRVDLSTKDPGERRLLNVVEEMAIASGLPMPAVFILPEEGINGFAAGNTPQDAAIAITRGGVNDLSRDELQGVVAHEFSHILNGDMRLNLRLAGLIFGILVISIIGHLIIRSLGRAALYGGARRRSRNGKGGGGGVVVILALGFGLIVIGFIGEFIGRIIQAGISRQREYLADAAAVQFTRNPSGIAGALKRIGAGKGSLVEDPRAETVAHLYFARALKSNLGGLWATHPPLKKRISAIEPSWDGRFSEPSSPRRSSEKEGSPDKQKSPGPTATGDFRIPGMEGHAALSALSLPFFLASIGQISPTAVDYAQRFRVSLPKELDAAAHDPAHAPILLLALFAFSDETVFAAQCSLIEKSDWASSRRPFESLSALLKSVADSSRLSLLESMLPALAERAQAERAALIKLARDFAFADGELHIQEVLLLAVLESRMGERTSGSPGLPVAVSRVLLTFAHLEVTDPAAANKLAFDAARLENLVAKTDTSHPTPAEFESALLAAARASMDFRRHLLSAAARIVWHDGTISPAESTCLRALGLTLQLPIPLHP